MYRYCVSVGQLCFRKVTDTYHQLLAGMGRKPAGKRINQARTKPVSFYINLGATIDTGAGYLRTGI